MSFPKNESGKPCVAIYRKPDWLIFLITGTEVYAL